MLTIIYYEMLNILVYLISLYFADTICIPTKSVDSSRVSVINAKKLFCIYLQRLGTERLQEYYTQFLITSVLSHVKCCHINLFSFEEYKYYY